MRRLVLWAGSLACIAFAAVGASPAYAAAQARAHIGVPGWVGAPADVGVPDRALAGPIAGLTADQIAAKAAADLYAASSVHVYGTAAEGRTKITLSITYTRHGCEEWIEFGKNYSLTTLQIGSHAWVKPSAAFWKGLGYTGSQLASVEGKWEKSKPDSQCKLKSLTGFPRTGWVTEKPVIVGGKHALRLFHNAKKAADRLHIDVSDSARPEILRVISDGSTAHFGKYNAPVRLMPPPPGDIIANPPPPGI